MNTASIVTIKPLYLARDDAAAYLSISTRTLEYLVSRREAPAPRKISDNRTAWLVDDLDAWGRQRPVSDLPPARCGTQGRARAASSAAASASK